MTDPPIEERTPPTERESDVLAFIRMCRTAIPPTSPTDQEIADHMTGHTKTETCSLAYAARLVEQLEKKGMIRREYNDHGQPLRRSITLAEEHGDDGGRRADGAGPD